MKRVLVLLFLSLGVILNADNVVNVDIKNSDLYPTNIMVGGGIGWGSSKQPVAWMDFLPDIYIPVLGATASIDFSKELSYSGSLAISLFTLNSNNFVSGGDAFTFFNPIKLENYLNIHLTDEESMKVTAVVLHYADTGYITYIDTTMLTLPIREITSIRIGKELNYDSFNGLNLNPLNGVSVGYDYTSYQDADLDTDKFGEVKVRQFTKAAIDLYMTGSLDLSNPLTMFGIKAEWNTVANNVIGMHVAGEIHFKENISGETGLAYSFYYIFGGIAQK
jgi:hypothetical protein